MVVVQLSAEKYVVKVLLCCGLTLCGVTLVTVVLLLCLGVSAQALGRMTEGFSGSDVSTVVKDVLMQPIRILRDATHFRKVSPT